MRIRFMSTTHIQVFFIAIIKTLHGTKNLRSQKIVYKYFF